MTVLTRRDGQILKVIVDRPEAGNRLDAATVEALTASFETAEAGADPPVAIVLSATGPDFSLGRERISGTAQSPKAITAEFEHIQRLNEVVQHSSAVTVAAVAGRAEGAGLSLAARCDIVVVADDARLSFPEIPHGVPPTIVLSHYRYVLPRNVLGDLFYTGRILNGEEAVRFGLAARSVPPAQLEVEVEQIAAQVASYDRNAIALVKDFLFRTETVTPTAAPGLGIAMYAVEMAEWAPIERSSAQD